MKRLFFKIYLGIALVLLVGTSATVYLLSQGLDHVRRQGVEERLVESATVLRERLQTMDQDSMRFAIREFSRATRMRVNRIPLRELDATNLKRMIDGEVFVEWEDREPRVYVTQRGQAAITLEPFRRGRRPPWPGRGRGPRLGGPPPEGGRPARGSDREGFWFARPNFGGAWLLLDRSQAPRFFLLGILGISVLLVGPAIYFLIRPMERRIQDLSHATEQFGRGELETRAEVVKDDALGDLTSTFNTMADEIKRLVEGQMELLRAVSHELRTPLARLFFVIDDAEAATSLDEKDEHLRKIQGTLTEMNDLVEELLTFVRMDSEQIEEMIETVSVEAVFDEVAVTMKDLRSNLDVQTNVACDTVRGIPRYFHRAVLNLGTNAARHAANRVIMTCTYEENYVEVMVEDDGPGVPENLREQILEPFARADTSRSSRIGGVGIGLAIVKRVMDLHGGRISIDDSLTGGARFTLSFPVSD